MYVCMYEFTDDTKQEILEPTLVSVFCWCTFKWFFVKVLESTKKISQEYFLDDPGVRLVAFPKSINKICEKQLQRNSFLRKVAPNPSTKSLKNTCEKIFVLENCSVSMNKIFEINMWRNSFFQFSIFLVILVVVLNAPLLMFGISFSNPPSRNSIFIHLV